MRGPLLLLLGACAPAPLPDPLPGEPAVDYEAAWTANTRELILREHLETRLIVRATLVDEALAEAQALTLARARLSPREDFEAQRAAALERAAGGWEFVFTAYAPPPERADDFGLGDGATWSLRLLADQRPVALVALDEVREPSPDEQRLYPQLDGWARLYRARFERPSDADTLELRAAGPRGQGAMIWELP